MKRSLLLLMCMFAALLLSSCHVDNDPWPISNALPVSAPTVVPTAASIPGSDESASNFVCVTAAPDAAEPPQSTAVPAVTQAPTDVPGGGVEPGING